MEFQGQGNTDGTLKLSAFAKDEVRKYLAVNGPARFTITFDLPESGKMRRWYEGAVVPLIAFYQEGMDHRSAADRFKVREWLKSEFNGEIVNIGGRVQRIAKSSKGRAVFNPFVERVTDWLIEQYAPPQQALDPEKFKMWRDTIRSFGGPDTYIDYLCEIGILKANNT